MTEKLAVVIATCRPAAFTEWFNAWYRVLDGCTVYVIEDQPKKSGELHFLSCATGWQHFSWEEIDADLGENSWIIPRRTSAIKSYGFMRAYADGADYIWTLDDDCLPDRGYEYPYVPIIKKYLRQEKNDDSWWNTIASSGLYPRGYPYGIRQATQPVGIHHGLWAGVPDLDGITALEYSDTRFKSVDEVKRVPTGKFFPMCGMNLAFRAELTPVMYFTLQGSERDHSLGSFSGTSPLPFDRFDDIWAGLFAKKICDHLGYAVTSGAPSIYHTKLSDPTQRVIKEGPGIAAHEILWKLVRDYSMPEFASTPASCYAQLACLVNSSAKALPFPDYWIKLAKAMQTWAEQF